MRHVDFDPTKLEGDDLNWWRRWSARADKATRNMVSDVERGETFSFNSAIWSELKQWLLRKVFCGKCAYCEVKFLEAFPGDAEHYRPKGKVTVKQNGYTRTVKRDGQTHPGYYWLVYNWRNLLPACEFCNSSNGKMNQFPVARSHIFSRNEGEDPDVLDIAEDPWLLHPYRDDPAEHLQFGVEGAIAPRNGSQKGAKSIEVYNLGRASLDAARKRAQENALNAFSLALVDRLRFGNDIKGTMERYTGSCAQFSQAVQDYLKLKGDDLLKELS